MRDLTTVESKNSTKTLEEHFEELMAEQDPSVLAACALRIVEEGGGISERNLAKFRWNLQNLAGDLLGLRKYLANYVLAGCNLGVGRITRGRY